MDTTPRFISIVIDHPSESERLNGTQTTATLQFDRRLRSGKLDAAPLGEGTLVRIIEEAAKALRILRDQNHR